MLRRASVLPHAPTFSNYDDLDDLCLAPGRLDGRETLAFASTANTGTPPYFIELSIVNGLIMEIRDFRYASYIAREATFEPSTNESPALAGSSPERIRTYGPPGTIGPKGASGSTVASGET